MSFLFPFLNFLQPGILWPESADLRPMLVASAVALIVGLLRKSDFKRSEAWSHPVFVWLMIFMILQVISVYYGGIYSMFEELTYWYIYPMFVVISVLLLSNVKSMTRYVLGMIVGGMVVVVYGIYSVPAWGGYIGSGRAGAYGMYENHNDYTFIIVQIMPFIFMYARTTKNTALQVLLAVCFLLCGIGIFMSLSRGGVLALALQLLLIALIGMDGKRRFLFVPFIVVAAIGAIGYQWAMRAENQSNYTAEDAEAGRLELWKTGLIMALKHPLLGTGSRRFSEYAHEYYDLSHDMRGKVSHNTYVEVLAGSGFSGLGAFLAMFYFLARGLHRAATSNNSPWLDAMRRATLIGLYTVLFRDMLDAKPHDWSLYVFCALGLACILLHRRLNSETGPGQREPLPATAQSVRVRLTSANAAMNRPSG